MTKIFSVVFFAVCCLSVLAIAQIQPIQQNQPTALHDLYSQIFEIPPPSGIQTPLSNTNIPLNDGNPLPLPVIPVQQLSPTPTPVINTEDSFDWKLTQKVFEQHNTNVIISPLSIKLLLAVLYEATGQNSLTQQELSIIHNNIQDTTKAREYFSNIIRSLKTPNRDYDFNLGTKIYCHNIINPTQKYSATVEQFYDTSIDKLDFADADTAAAVMNNWCSNITAGHINNLVEKSAVQNSMMIMLNAIYFNGLWEKQFFPNETALEPFEIAPSQTVQTEFLVHTDKYFFVDSPELNAKIARLPYAGNKFSMYVVLPHAKGDLSNFVNNIDGQKFARAEALMSEMTVEVHIPKFKFEFLTNMNSALEQLGIRDVFSLSASLPLFSRGAPGDSPLRVSNILQKVGIEVNEKGSTVYAASDISFTSKFDEIHFIADRPFVFMIKDHTTNAIIFTGKIVNP